MDEAEQVPTLGELESLMDDEVTKVIMGMASMSCESDPMPTNLLKEILQQVIKPITKTINILTRIRYFC